jgi:ATP-dependent RNA helicase DDX18/HAS1
LEKLISKNYYLHQSATEGFKSYIQSYASYSLKTIFNVHELDLNKVARSFGFKVAPKVNIPVGSSIRNGKKRKRNQEDEGSEGEEEDDEEVEGEISGITGERSRRGNDRRDSGKGREKEKRRESLGSKKVKQEFYKNGREKEGEKKRQWVR